MGKMTKKAAIVELMTGAGVAVDLATQFTSAFLEYHEAVENVERVGSVVSHPRTAAIMPNPYLKVRDAAEKRLQTMRKLINVKILDYVWTKYGT